VGDDGAVIVRDWSPPSAQDVQIYCVPEAPGTGELAAIVCELPGTQLNVCGDVYVTSSTTIEPDGFAVAVIGTEAGGDVDVLVD
jgi:hypothetical protein